MKSVRVLHRSLFAHSQRFNSSVALTEEFPNVPAGTPESTPIDVTLSTTGSGLKVLSDTTNPRLVSLGIQVNTGTQYETEETAGLTQLMSKMSFRCTEQRSDIRLYRDIENIGGVIDSSYGRDFVNFQITVLPEYAEEAMEILAESLLAPKFAPWDVKLQQQRALDDIEEQTGGEILSDSLYDAAFYDTTPLGRGLTSADNLKNLTSEHLHDMHQKFVNTQDVSLVGTGIDHQSLVSLADAYLSGLPTASSPAAPPAVKYVGGEHRCKLDTNQTYVALAFNGVSWSDPALATSYVLQNLISSKLSSWTHKPLYSAADIGAFNDVYGAGGLFGVSGSTNATNAEALVDNMVAVIKETSSITYEELVKAKAATATEYALGLDSRDMRMQTYGNMAQYNNVSTVPEIVARINAVTKDDVSKLVQQLRQSPPALASVGKLSYMPRLNDVLSKLQ